MFTIFKEVFFESDLTVFGLVLIVVGFFLSEFALKKLNTKLILNAVLIIIYVISSFLVESGSSYLICFIFLFIGGAAVSLFFGVTADIVFRLIKKKN